MSNEGTWCAHPEIQVGGCEGREAGQKAETAPHNFIHQKYSGGTVRSSWGQTNMFILWLLTQFSPA